jgi:hypothetical protein
LEDELTEEAEMVLALLLIELGFIEADDLEFLFQ